MIKGAAFLLVVTASLAATVAMAAIGSRPRARTVPASPRRRGMGRRA